MKKSFRLLFVVGIFFCTAYRVEAMVFGPDTIIEYEVKEENPSAQDSSELIDSEDDGLNGRRRDFLGKSSDIYKPGTPLSETFMKEHEQKKIEREMLSMNVSRGRALRNMIEIGQIPDAKIIYNQLTPFEKDLIIYYFYWLEKKDMLEKLQREVSELEMEEEFITSERILEILTGGPIGESQFIDTLFRIKSQGLPLHEKIISSKQYRHLDGQLSRVRNSFKK